MLRRMFGPYLIGAGIFLIVMAYLLPFVVYPKLAILPTDPQASQIAHGTGFNVFFPRSVDEGGIQQLTNVSVTSKVFVSEDDSDGRKPADSPNAHWRVATRTYVDEKGPGDAGLLETTIEGVSLDRHTSLANNCCGDYMQTQKDQPGKPLEHEGYVFMFPFGTKKQSYPLWDGTAERTFPAVYDGTEDRRGFTTYRFEQNVPSMKTGTQALPGELFGHSEPTITADYLYQTQRTYWIEPHSGAIVDYRETMDRRFSYDGVTIPVIQGTLSLIPTDPKEPLAKLLRTAASGLPLLRWRLPLLFLPLGLILIVAGVVRVRRVNAADRAAANPGWNDENDPDDQDDWDDAGDWDDAEPEPAGLDALLRTRP